MTAKIKKEKKSILLENTFLPFGVEMLFSWFIIVLFTMYLHLQTRIYLLTLLTFPYFQGFPPLKILYMYPFPLFLPLWDNYKGKFIIQLFNHCLLLYQEFLRKSALLPL